MRIRSLLPWLVLFGACGCDLFTSDYIRAFEMDGDVQTIEFSPDGALLMVGAGRSRIWTVRDWRQIYDSGPREMTEGVAFSPDGRRILVYDQEYDQRCLRVLGIDSEAILEVSLVSAGDLRHFSISADSTYAAVANSDCLEIRQLDSLKRVDRLGEAVDLVQFALDGLLLAAGLRENGEVFLRYELEEDQLREVSYVARSVHCEANDISFSADGSVFMLVGEGVGESRLWSYPAFEHLWTLDEWSVDNVAFSPDGEWIAVGGRQKGLRLVRAQDGKRIVDLDDPDPDSKMCVAASPDGKYIVSSYRNWVRIWDVQSILSR
ncbi:MAG: WD40 repeat domain-containing protein [Deltaproteobacteria bacterium]|nr:WD40 repeat domain-containing protein [Deltaproteobacteria bacterium]